MADANVRKHDLKPLSAAAVPRSIEKAERYRLINQPWAAESICLDVLRTAPGDQRALHVLVLSLTDQFTGESGELARRAQEALAQVTSEYERAYYAGMILERRATAKLASRAPGAGFIAYEWVREAMDCYANAEQLKPAGNDDAILRWNSCVRMLAARADLRPAPQDASVPVLGE